MVYLLFIHSPATKVYAVHHQVARHQVDVAAQHDVVSEISRVPVHTVWGGLSAYRGGPGIL